MAKAVAYGKRVKLYPLSQAANPPPTVFVDAIDVVFDSAIPYDLRFFQSLNGIVQNEPWLERDKAMIDQLKSIGIEGQALQPRPQNTGNPQGSRGRSESLVGVKIRERLCAAVLRRQPMGLSGLPRSHGRTSDIFRQA